MIFMYYKIWVSLFLRIKETQNNNSKLALVLSLIVLTTTNIINYYFFSYLSLVLIKVNINILNLINIESKYFSIFLTSIIFFIPNYFLLIYNGKHERLLMLFKDNVSRNLGLYYFVVSCFLVVFLIFSMILFPQTFGLVKVK